MTSKNESIIILMADDDADDRELTREALRAAHLLNELRTVSDGVELLEYLRREGAYAESASAPRPGLILLDLNSPAWMDARPWRRSKPMPPCARFP